MDGLINLYLNITLQEEDSERQRRPQPGHRQPHQLLQPVPEVLCKLGVSSLKVLSPSVTQCCVFCFIVPIPGGASNCSKAAARVEQYGLWIYSGPWEQVWR